MARPPRRSASRGPVRNRRSRLRANWYGPEVNPVQLVAVRGRPQADGDERRLRSAQRLQQSGP
jgi:hypothetical protein